MPCLDGQRDSRFPIIDHNDSVNGLCSACKNHPLLVCLHSQEGEMIELKAQQLATADLSSQKRASKKPESFECDPNSLKDCYRTGKTRKQNMKPETEGIQKQHCYTRKSNKPQESIRQIFEDAGVDMPAVLQKN